jgi:bifunctional DNA-binding transcriptional regulator/antitoxin component of YhaV-PrlF toxin-antitoxin module
LDSIIMSTVLIRDRRQITLPSDIVLAAGLQVNDALEVSLINGVIQLVPAGRAAQRRQSMARFQGAASGIYGESAAEVDAYVREQRDGW